MCPHQNHFDVLFCAEDESLLSNTASHLGSAGISAAAITDGSTVLDFVHRNPVNSVLLDWAHPSANGADILASLLAEFPSLPVIIMTGHENVDIAVTSMKMGAFDCLKKPVPRIRLIETVQQALQFGNLKKENHALKECLLSRTLQNQENFDGIVTASEKMFGIFQYIEAIAHSRMPVLITGETGVGKELLARAVHKASGQSGNFVPLTISGLDDFSFSDTLFGHKKGAFTNATTNRGGLIQEAAAGTLFLDEIGDLSPSCQIKILRLVQENEYYPVGSDQLQKSTARIIAASNADFIHLMKKKAFRSDLFYRLAVHHIHIPSLKERPEDLAPLVKFFTRLAAQSLKRPTPPIDPKVFTALASCDFPGNIRLLQNMTLHAVALRKRGPLKPSDFAITKSPSPTKQKLPLNDPLLSIFGKFPTLDEMEDYLLEQALFATKGKHQEAAHLLGIPRSTVTKKIQRFLQQRQRPRA